jgi:hypothetical protein
MRNKGYGLSGVSKDISGDGGFLTSVLLDEYESSRKLQRQGGFFERVSRGQAVN